MWRLFRRSRSADAVAAWWNRANDVAEQATREAVAGLRSADAGDLSLDEQERRQEMIEGLEQLVDAVGQPALPVLTTQHRVIGPDDCHFMTPISLPGTAGASGKLFLTSRRLVVATGEVRAVPWHRIRRLARAERDLLAILGETSAVHVQCNTYGEALVARHIGLQLIARVQQGP